MTRTSHKANKAHQQARSDDSGGETGVASAGEGKQDERRVPRDRAAPIHYAMRAECPPDCDLMRAILAPWVCVWAELQAQVPSKDGTCIYISDVGVAFSVVPEGPHLGEIRWLLNCIVDGHVAAESVSLDEEYTGERVVTTNSSG